MTSFGKKFITVLGHSDLTAKFQNLCGIKKLDTTVVSNGVQDSQSSGKNGVTVGTSYDTNGFVSSTIGKNSCESSAGSISNGHANYACDALKERKNGFKSHEPINGLKNGYASGHENGSVNNVSKPQVANGHIVHSHTLNNGIDKSITQKSSINGYINSHCDYKESVVSPESSELQTKNYTIDNRLLYYIFTFGAGLGNDIFYIMYFTFTLWNFDSFVCRKSAILWIVVMYIGQAAKDVIRWPRPTSPPVVRLEERYELEYGMPSTHAMVGVVIPFGLLYFMSLSGRYEFNLVLAIVFAIIWSILVSFSRLYLGMHSVLDIIAGICFAFILMAATAPFVDPIDRFLISHPNSVPVSVAACLVLCLLYPSLDKWSTARGDTTVSLAVFSGIYAGLWMTGALTNFKPEKDSPPYVLALPTLAEAGFATLRQVLGVVVLVSLLTVLKVAILKGLCSLTGYDSKDPNTKRHLHIELPYRYVPYFVGSWAAVYVVPLIFLKLNIARDGFYSEIFNY